MLATSLLKPGTSLAVMTLISDIDLLNDSSDRFSRGVGIVERILRQKLHNTHFPAGASCPHICKSTTAVNSELESSTFAFGLGCHVVLSTYSSVTG